MGKQSNLLPVTLHMTLLQINVAIGNLTGIAGIWVGGRPGCLHARHDLIGIMATAMQIQIQLTSIDLSLSAANVCSSVKFIRQRGCECEGNSGRVSGIWRGCIDNVTQKRLSVRWMTDFFFCPKPRHARVPGPVS
jgi:hypothetical protein